ncbi:MAG: hypothetical protein JO189_16090 [Deltaproteobacteria bacterium]|nr:hypothetical protein [Deltaproteobacteria bacterium]
MDAKPEPKHKGVVVRARRRAKPKIAANADGNYGLVYNGGPVVECAYVYPIFLGTQWQDNESYAALAGQLQLFLSDYYSSSAVSMLRQYGFLSGAFIAAHFEGASAALDDAGLAQLVSTLHAEGIVPDDAANQGTSQSQHIALVFFDDTVGFSDSNIGAFGQGLYGYHSVNTALRNLPFYYGAIAPMDDTSVAPDPGMAAVPQLDRICRVSTHELSEWVSDPFISITQAPTGWYSQSWGEIGDICEGYYGNFQVSHSDGTVNTWAMQLIYSLADDAAGNTPCVASSQAGYVAPADKAIRSVELPAIAAAHRGRELLPAAYRDRGLLPLPPTYRVAGGRLRRQLDVYRYGRHLMADFPHTNVHPQIPALLREIADALDREKVMVGRDRRAPKAA